MLTSLSIKNIAIIDRLDIDFEKGFNVMTGETGAGKTIIVQSLGLVLGDRASSDFIRSGEEEADVTASFSLGTASPRSMQNLKDILEPAGIDLDGDELIIRRVINIQGRGKITVNGVPVTLQMLKTVAEQLVDISSQHQHQMLIDPANHASLIDDYGVPAKTVEGYRRAFAEYSKLKADVDRLRAEEASAKEKLDFLKYQLDELEAAAPKPGELEELQEKRNRMKHSVKLKDHAREVSSSLYDAPGSAVEVLGNVAGSLNSMANLDQALKPMADAMERLQAEVSELSRDVKAYAQGLSGESGRFEEVEDRIHLLRGLVRKHGGTLEDIINKMGGIAEEIELAENYDDVLAEREAGLNRAEKKLKEEASQLSKSRRSASERLAKVVQGELAGLAMGKVRFTSRIEALPIDQWDSSGPDRVEFFIAPNVGEELKPLVRIASGGELSRVMLAIKRVLADKASLASTYIFDEVDSGIGGATAEVVGKKLAEVAQARQVICITHLPQVACFGGAHYRISKRVESGRTKADIFKLDEVGRVDEIARMLGGEKITRVTKTHAEELLKTVFRSQNGKGKMISS